MDQQYSSILAKVQGLEDEMDWEIALDMVVGRLIKAVFPQLSIDECFEKMRNPVFMQALTWHIAEISVLEEVEWVQPQFAFTEETDSGEETARRYCYICSQVTDWSIKSYVGGWEEHFCRACDGQNKSRVKTT